MSDHKGKNEPAEDQVGMPSRTEERLVVHISQARRFATIKKQLHEEVPYACSAPSEYGSSMEEEDEQDRLQRQSKAPGSPFSFASDSELDPADLSQDVLQWRGLISDRKLFHQTREYARHYCANSDTGEDIYTTTRKRTLLLLHQFAPDAPRQPFIAASDDLCARTVRENFHSNALEIKLWNERVQREQDQERMTELTDDVARARERLHIFKNARRTTESEKDVEMRMLQESMEKKQRETMKRHEEDIKTLTVSFGKTEKAKDLRIQKLEEALKNQERMEARRLDSEFFDMRADLAKRTRQNIKLTEQIRDLQEDLDDLREDMGSVKSKRDAQEKELKERKQKFINNAQRVIKSQQDHNDALVAELLRIADGDIDATDSQVVRQERRKWNPSGRLFSAERFLGEF
ncbi:unnamed protein product [Tilletia caries]|nr:hypothetical protein CF336_g4429 [Tilletia laevis]CAD6886914.1 unnamed protein product [Tilletia caries]